MLHRLQGPAPDGLQVSTLARHRQGRSLDAIHAIHSTHAPRTRVPLAKSCAPAAGPLSQPHVPHPAPGADAPSCLCTSSSAFARFPRTWIELAAVCEVGLQHCSFLLSFSSNSCGLLSPKFSYSLSSRNVDKQLQASVAVWTASAAGCVSRRCRHRTPAARQLQTAGSLFGLIHREPYIKNEANLGIFHQPRF